MPSVQRTFESKQKGYALLKFSGGIENSAGSAFAPVPQAAHRRQMTRKKLSKVSADASCPISAGVTGFLQKAGSDVCVQRKKQGTNLFCKGNK